MSRRVELVLLHGSSASVPLHVQLVISSYLGPPPNMTLSKTCSFGSIALLDWMWGVSCSRASERTPFWSLTNFLRSEPHYYRYQFEESMKVAATRGDLAVVEWLLEHFRGCVVPGEAVGNAAENGHLHILKLLWHHDGGHHDRERQVSTKRKVEANSGETTCRGCASNNVVCWGDATIVGVRHPDVVQWLHEHLLPKRDDELEEAIRAAVNVDLELATVLLPPGRCLLDYAALSTNPELIEWMLDCGYLQRDASVAVRAIRDLVFRSENLPLMQRIAEQHKPPPLEWKEVWKQAMAFACQSGQLKILQWLAEHPTGVRICGDIKRQEDALDVASMALDHMPADVAMLQYLYEKDLFVENVSLTVLVVAIHDGQPLEVLEWLVDHQLDLQQLPGYCVMDEASAWGRVDVLQYFQSLACTTSSFARGEENAEASLWCTIDAMDEAAANGHLDVVKWVHENRSEGCTAAAMDGAASNGELEVVKWLHEHRTEGCTTDAMDEAAGGGHLDVVQWLHSNRGEGCTSVAMDSAARSGHLDVVKWLHRHRSEGATKDAMDGAADNGHLDVVQWLHEHRSEGCTVHAVHSVAVHGHFEVLLFLRSQRTEGYSRKTLVDAASGNINIVEWLRQHCPVA